MNRGLIPRREDYTGGSLERDDMEADPMVMFKAWMENAVEAGVPEANAVCLCTVDEEGYPDGRMVLLKGVEEGALIFYTNYQSRKGDQLRATPRGAMVFWWKPLDRQVRLSGEVEQVEEELSDGYFATRPRDSQLGAWASSQSRPIPDRDSLEDRLERMEKKFPGAVPRPDYWGGYRLIPRRVEFWQGRSSRLHDRFVYTKDTDGSWRVERLMP